MNRLTKRTTNGPLPVLVRDRAFGPAYFISKEDYTDYRDALEKLAQYEDTGLEPEEVERYAKAEKEGRLVVLPCKVGDMVYFRRGRDIIGDTVECIILDGIDNQVIAGMHKAFMFWDFGRNVFLTREDVEVRLR